MVIDSAHVTIVDNLAVIKILIFFGTIEQCSFSDFLFIDNVVIWN